MQVPASWGGNYLVHDGRRKVTILRLLVKHLFKAIAQSFSYVYDTAIVTALRRMKRRRGDRVPSNVWRPVHETLNVKPGDAAEARKAKVPESLRVPVIHRGKSVTT